MVIGGGRGIGAAIATAFTAEGAQVAVLDILPDVEETALKLPSKTSVRVTCLTADATDLDALRTAAETIETELGPWNHVIYAAGLGSGKVGFPFWNLDPADWDRVLRVNLMGAVNTAHVFAPSMAERGDGTLLF